MGDLVERLVRRTVYASASGGELDAGRTIFSPRKIRLRSRPCKEGLSATIWPIVCSTSAGPWARPRESSRSWAMLHTLSPVVTMCVGVTGSVGAAAAGWGRKATALTIDAIRIVMPTRRTRPPTRTVSPTDGERQPVLRPDQFMVTDLPHPIGL